MIHNNLGPHLISVMFALYVYRAPAMIVLGDLNLFDSVNLVFKNNDNMFNDIILKLRGD